MRRSAQSLLLAALIALIATAGATASAAPAPKVRPRSALQQWHGLLRANGGKRTPALMTRWRGALYQNQPRLLDRQVKLTKRQRKENRDPTFRGTHPMFKRLVKSGWYGKEQKISQLQQAANALKKNRKISRNKALADVEILSFDLEATSGSSGKFDKKSQRFLNGWDEVMQFGYTVHKGGKIIESGSIPIRPDTFIPRPVAKLTGLDHKKLAKAPRFEQVAGKILEVMKGRVLLGQSAIQKDWSWLQSNFARLGVQLPAPRGMILDTYLLSFNHFPAGAGVKRMSEHYRIKPQGQLHDAKTDAQVTGHLFEALMRQNGAKTLGDAFKLQRKGYEIQHSPRPQP